MNNQPWNQATFIPAECESKPGFYYIPGASLYVINSSGDLFNLETDELEEARAVKTTHGHYWAYNIFCDIVTGKQRAYAHRLMALAFKGFPKIGQTQVNHIDGNKVNNGRNNVEWVTRGENQLHAYKERLRKESRVVIVTDLETGEEVRCHSMTHAVEQFGIESKQAWNFILAHSKTPYLGRWQFTIDQSVSVIPKNNDVRRDIYVKNYRTGEEKIYSDSAMVELDTGVKRSTVLYRIRTNARGFANGYVFKVREQLPFPEIDSLLIAQLPEDGNMEQCWMCVHSETNEIKYLPSIKAMTAFFGLTRDAIYLRQKVGKLVDGWKITLRTDLLP